MYMYTDFLYKYNIMYLPMYYSNRTLGINSTVHSGGDYNCARSVFDY